MKKDWRNMSDKELDDFFREQSENPDIPFVPEDWEKMKQKLGIPPTNGGGASWFSKTKLIWWGALLLLLGFGGWLTWNGLEQNSIQENREGVIRQEVNGSSSPDAGNVQDKDGQKPVQSVDQIPQDVTGQMENPTDHPDSQQHKVGNTWAGGTGESLTGKQENQQEYSGNKASLLSDQPTRSQVSHSVEMSEHDPAASTEEFRWGAGKLEKIDKADYPVFVPKEEKKEKPAFRDGYRWNVAVLLSPDISALKWNNIHGVGTSAGLNAEYFVHPDWSITLGALYSFKTYQGGEGYNASGGYGTSSPVGVKGDCYVLDIPLNVRFYAINHDLDRWYASAGLSSYMMLREKYELKYNGNGGYPSYKELDIKNQNRHFFKVVNLSMGYERVLSNRMSLQVEPYFKVPLQGVGEGGVSLKSAGVLLGLKYNW